MDLTVTILIGAIVLLIAASIFYISFNGKAKTSAPVESHDNSTKQMQLAAYERLILLVDRIALPNLISRLNQPGASAKEMQLILTQNLKQEFDYNITQQIYVSADSWNAVKNLKEQNQLVINQIANALPPHATGMDLNKLLLEYLMNDKKGSLHEVVSEVLSYEAKKLLV
jgi:hypothetical protein